MHTALDNRSLLPQCGRVGWDLEPRAAVEKQFQLPLPWRCVSAIVVTVVHHREADRLFSGRAELMPPPVERILTELMFAAECPHPLASTFLLSDALTTPFSPL